MNDTPIAMPAHYGYGITNTNDEAEFFRKAREAAKLADLSAGMEERGDKIAERLKNQKYVGFVERPDMEKIVSESMKEVYAQHSSDILARQVGGTHYKRGVQPWTIAMDWGLDPWSHNVVKYILRFPYKNGVEDLEKIKHYLDFLIENHDEVVSKYYK